VAAYKDWLLFIPERRTKRAPQNYFSSADVFIAIQDASKVTGKKSNQKLTLLLR